MIRGEMRDIITASMQDVVRVVMSQVKEIVGGRNGRGRPQTGREVAQQQSEEQQEQAVGSEDEQAEDPEEEEENYEEYDEEGSVMHDDGQQRGPGELRTSPLGQGQRQAGRSREIPGRGREAQFERMSGRQRARTMNRPTPSMNTPRTRPASVPGRRRAEANAAGSNGYYARVPINHTNDEIRGALVNIETRGNF